MCGVGPVKKGLKGIRDSYSLSFKAMKVGYTLSRNQFLYFYKKLEPYCELEKILVSPSEHVFTSVLGAVKNQELLDTLVMYYECGANMERVSDRMYTHKNTVKYRLNRLQELTGLDLRNPDDNFRLYLAVLALKMNFKISFEKMNKTEWFDSMRHSWYCLCRFLILLFIWTNYTEKP